jgi:hypothetical protein
MTFDSEPNLKLFDDSNLPATSLTPPYVSIFGLDNTSHIYPINTGSPVLRSLWRYRIATVIARLNLV